MDPDRPARSRQDELQLGAFGSPGSGEPLQFDGPDVVDPAGSRYRVADGRIPVFSDAGSPWVDANEHATYSSHAERPEAGPRRVADDVQFIRDLIPEAEGGRLPPFGGGPWLDATYDVLAQEACYRYVGDLRGKAVLQVGGKGFHSAKAVVAGASEVYLVTPVLSEARYFIQMAELATRTNPTCAVHVAVGVAEALPLPSDSVDAVLSGGCLHHTDVPIALEQVHRVLKPGGRFGGWDPYRSVLYRVGTGVLGKREPGVNCRPLDAQRLRGAPDGTMVELFSPLARYLLLAGFKAGLRTSLERSRAIQLLEHRLLSRWGWTRRFSSSAALMLERRP